MFKPSVSSSFSFLVTFGMQSRFETLASLGWATVRCSSYHGVAHVYNHWSGMPSLAEQEQQMQGFTAVFTVLCSTPLKMSYEIAKKRAAPYTRIVEELPQMRSEAVQLVRRVGSGRHAYVLVNNRAEGNAPLTVGGS